MATLVVNGNSYIRPYRFGRIVHYAPETASTYERGDVLIPTADTDQPGTVKISGALVDASVIVGVAAEDAADALASDAGKGAVWVADQDSEFRAHMVDGVATTAGLPGTSAGLVLDTAKDVYRVITTDTDNDASIVITEVLGTVGDTNGEVAFRFKNAATKIYGV
jgi:hypothetical protein